MDGVPEQLLGFGVRVGDSSNLDDNRICGCDTTSRVYTDYAFEVTQTRLASATAVAIAELEFYDCAGKNLKPHSWSNPGGDKMVDGQGPAAAFDGYISTGKWADRNRKPLIATFNAPVRVASYHFVTAGNQDESPVSWLVKARPSPSDDWEILAQVLNFNTPTTASTPAGPWTLFSPIPAAHLSHATAGIHTRFIDVSCSFRGRYVFVFMPQTPMFFHFAEAEVFGPAFAPTVDPETKAEACARACSSRPGFSRQEYPGFSVHPNRTCCEFFAAFCSHRMACGNRHAAIC